MLKKLLYIFIIPFILFGCNEGENPNQIPEDLPRLDELKENYKSILVSSENGWKARYQPSDNSGVYTILMKFKDDGFVDIESDLNGYLTATQKTLYDVKGATFPELVFETFCVWHQIYEVADGEFQFRVLEIDENAVKLGTASSGEENLLVTFARASSEDYQNIEGKQEINNILFNYYDNSDEYFKVIEFNNQNIKGLVDFDFDTHQFYISYTDNNGNAQNNVANYSYDENGIEFVSQLTINGVDIDRFDVTLNSDSTISLSNNEFDNGSLISTNLPDFEFKGAVELFNEYTFYYVGGYSPSLDTLDEQIQKAGLFVIPQIYRNYALGTQSYNALTFLIFETEDIYDFYGFNISSFQKLGEDWMRFQWSGSRDSNIDNELFTILRNYILFFFDKNGFKVVPNRGVFTLISKADPDKYIIVVPAG